MFDKESRMPELRNGTLLLRTGEVHDAFSVFAEEEDSVFALITSLPIELSRLVPLTANAADCCVTVLRAGVGKLRALDLCPRRRPDLSSCRSQHVSYFKTNKFLGSTSSGCEWSNDLLTCLCEEIWWADTCCIYSWLALQCNAIGDCQSPRLHLYVWILVSYFLALFSFFHEPRNLEVQCRLWSNGTNPEQGMSSWKHATNDRLQLCLRFVQMRDLRLELLAFNHQCISTCTPPHSLRRHGVWEFYLLRPLIWGVMPSPVIVTLRTVSNTLQCPDLEAGEKFAISYTRVATFKLHSQ